MQSKKLVFVISLVLLSLSIWIWVDWFVFGKVSPPDPAWQQHIPPLIRGTTPMVLVSLLPAFFLTRSAKEYAQAVGLAIIIAPWPALIMFGLEMEGRTLAEAVTNLFISFLIDLVWIFIQCVVPAIFFLIIKAIWQWLISRLGR